MDNCLVTVKDNSLFGVPRHVWPTFWSTSRRGPPINPILFWNYSPMSWQFRCQKISLRGWTRPVQSSKEAYWYHYLYIYTSIYLWHAIWGTILCDYPMIVMRLRRDYSESTNRSHHFPSPGQVDNSPPVRNHRFSIPIRWKYWVIIDIDNGRGSVFS